jgi:DNA-binding MarR family transcriptional regulator
MVTESAAEQIAILVTELGKRFAGYFEAQAASLDLTGPQAAVIAYLDRPMPMKQVANMLHCDASNVTGLVDRLESRGLVERRVRRDDRRIKELVLTAEGRRVHGKVAAIVQSPSGLALSNSEQKHLIELLTKAVSALPPT